MTGLATQQEVLPFSDALARLKHNFDFHVNSPLGKAHGVELIHGWIDPYGNDLRVYQDSGGHAVSDTNPALANFLRLVVNGVPCYVAVQHPGSDPGAQPPSASAASAALPVPGAPGSTTLITDYAAFESLSATNTNSLLLEHTQREAQHAHLPLALRPEVLLSPDGHAVATHRLRFQFKGSLYELPASPRMGGPFQPLRSVSLVCDKPYVSIPAGAANSVDVNFTAAAAGTRPFTYTYEWSITNTTGSYVAFPYPGNGIINNQLVTLTGWSPGITCSANLNTPSLHLSLVQPGSDNTARVYIRCLVGQPGAGSVYTNTILFTAHDATGNWIVMETFKPLGGLTPAHAYSLHRLRLWSLRHHPEETTFYLGADGRELVQRARRGGYDFNRVLAHVQFLTSSAPYGERYQLFHRLVVDLMRRFWPDCPHPLWGLRHRGRAKEADGDLLGAAGGDHHSEG